MDYVENIHLNYIIETVDSDENLNDGKKAIEFAKINIKEVDTASEENPKTSVEDQNIINMEDISMFVTNKEAMTEIITVNSKEENVMEKMKISLTKGILPCV